MWPRILKESQKLQAVGQLKCWRVIHKCTWCALFPYAQLGSCLCGVGPRIEAGCRSSTLFVRRVPPMSQILEKLRSNVSCTGLAILRVMRV